MDNFRQRQIKTEVMQDLDLSSDSEAEEIQEVSISPNNIQSYEDAILLDDDDVEMDDTANTVSSIQPRNNLSGPSLNATNISSSIILAGEENAEVLTSNKTVSRMNNARSLINYGNVEPLDFENVITKRKAQTSASTIRSRSTFERPNSATTTRKVYNANPRDSIALDESIGRRITSPIAHKRSNVQEPQDPKRMEKLKQGLQSVAEESIFNNAERNSGNRWGSDFPTFKPDPWSSLQLLIKYGYNICWTTMQLDKEGELATEGNDRLYRCSISCRANNADITGVSEAAKVMMAMHGAAADVIKKMIACLGLERMGSVSADIDESMLIDDEALTALKKKLEEEWKQNVYIKQYCGMERIQGSRIYTHTLYINSIKFEATSYVNAVYARLSAIKNAYEEIIKERCPRRQIFIGEECTQDESLYRVIKSQASISFDLTQSKLMSEEFKSKNLSGRAGGFRGRRVKVCNEGPEIGFSYS